MATYATSIDVSSFTTDAKFRAWVSAVHNAMAGAGFVQTSDTGQINPATVLKPTTTATMAGYEIWRFNDSLQSTAPIFLYLEYRSSTVASGNGIALHMQIATGSNGTGTPTGLGVYMNPGISGSTTALSNSAAPVMACHTAGFGMIMPGGLVSTSNNAGFYAVARTCDTSGNLTAEGVTIYRQPTANSLLCVARSMSFAVGQLFAQNSPTAAHVSAGASLAAGDSVPMAKHYANLGKPVPLSGVLSYYNGDVAAGSTFSTPLWGSTSHTFFAFGTSYLTGMEYSSTATVTGAFLWE